jgi:hypothetical protein
MLRSKRIAALLVAVATISALISLISSSREPTYQGKSLTFWLTELQSTNGPQRQQAKRAIHEMGPKAVPALIDRLGYHTPFWRRELEYLSTRQKFFHISVIDEDAYAKLAVDGFWAANTNAIVCLPELTRMLNSRDCGRAGIALMYLGSAAIPALTNAFASPDPHVRAAAVQWLGVNQRCFGPLWSNVLPMLKDGSVEVRHSAV